MAEVRASAALSIGVVVPTLDEEARIVRCLLQLKERCGFERIVVSDGGSADGTVAAAGSITGVTVVAGVRGRGRQLNRGAEALPDVDVLCFVHADVSLPTNARGLIARAMSPRGVVAGAFRTWTVADGPRRPWWRPLLHLADLRSRYSRLPYGDQVLFVRKDAFWAVGGFPDQPLMEDLELSIRLRQRGRIARVRGSVEVSGRRFIEQPLLFTAIVNTFPLLYRLGVPPATLRKFYPDVR